MTYLNVSLYSAEHELHGSDQVLVPASVWKEFDRDHEGTGPIFVGVDGVAVGRLRPAVMMDDLPSDTCRVPEWMWLLLGAPGGPDQWVELTVRRLPVAGTISLRARREATMMGADPVAMLTAALSGQMGPSWACLSVGAELPLSCGVFDVMDIQGLDGESVAAASILDCDVNLDIVSALDAGAVEDDAPVPVPVEGFLEPVVSGNGTRFVEEGFVEPVVSGFVPFSGKGYRLNG
jgi:hypothetical protein